MINVETIDFPGTKNIIDNIKFYKNKFINDSILVFRNANLSFEEQSDLHNQLGEKFGWFTPKEDNEELSKYIEDHATNNRVGIANKDEIMLSWHIEHVYYDNKILAGTWNMLVFNIDNENGKTYFVDSEKIYSRMSDDWKDFLNRCTISAKDFGLEDIFENFKPIQNHWITNNPLIRVRVAENRDGINNLVLFDGENPTKEQDEKFKDIVWWFSNEVINNEDIRMVHKWQKGDLVIPDMFKLAHAVTGGFNPEDRRFIGIWGYQKDK
jgi:alpha-ketoglutarate-dependent taurine dioxygenase